MCDSLEEGKDDFSTALLRYSLRQVCEGGGQGDISPPRGSSSSPFPYRSLSRSSSPPLQVPEGHALLDLSLGPGPSAGIKKAAYGAATLVGTLLNKLQIGEPPLQTQLTTSLLPIAEIRRKRDFYFGKFPTPEDFRTEIMRISGSA